MDFRVYKSDDGSIMVVQSKYDDFVATFQHGQWMDELTFDPSELNDIPAVDDPHEAQVIVKDAKKALNRW